MRTRLTLLAIILSALGPPTATAEEDSRQRIKIYGSLPFTSLTLYDGDLDDGFSVAVLGGDLQYARDFWVVEGGLHLDFFSALGSGGTADLRGGLRSALTRGQRWAVDATGQAGFQYLSYTSSADAHDSSEQAILAQGRATVELYPHRGGPGFAIRLFVDFLLKLDRHGDNYEGYESAMGVNHGIEAGLGLGAAF